jgi:hypothetical protein
MPGSPIDVREAFDFACGELLVRGEPFPMGHSVHQTVLDRIGHCVEELLFQTPVVDGFLTPVSSREHGSFSSQILVNTAGNEGVAELVEVDEILYVFGTIGQGCSTRLFMIDVKIYPVKFNRVFSLGTANRSPDDVSNSSIRGKEKLTVNSALYFAVSCFWTQPSETFCHGVTSLCYPSIDPLAERFPKIFIFRQKRREKTSLTYLT